MKIIIWIINSSLIILFQVNNCLIKSVNISQGFSDNTNWTVQVRSIQVLYDMQPSFDYQSDGISPETQNTETVAPNIWVIVTASGIFGGILYGMRDRKVIIPHRKSKNVLVPGFLLDAFFGLAGGFIVFMIIPGDFNLLAGDFEIIKIIGVATLGGYGGRALVERVFEHQIQKLENDIQEIRDQSHQDAIAESLLSQHLDDDPDTPLVSKSDLKKAIFESSSRVKLLAFNMARGFRKGSEPNKISRAIPIFEALIDADVDRKYHRNHAQLGYIYKDKSEPDIEEAKKEFTIAINVRDKENVDGWC